MIAPSGCDYCGKIGIIIADKDEYATFLSGLGEYETLPYSYFSREGVRFPVCTESGCADVTVCLCGIGKVNSAAAAMHLIDEGCDCILSCGLSGGISGVSRGQICLCNRFAEHDFDLTVIGFKPYEKPGQRYIYDADKRLCDIVLSICPGIAAGTAVSGDRFVCDEVLRKRLKDDLNAMSCDMETAAIASVCDMAGVPFCALRKISDDAGADAETSYREMNNAEYSDLGGLMLALIRAIASRSLPHNGGTDA